MLSDQVPYFILDLLQQTPSVYVKGLGRFEAIFHPAVVDLPGSRIKPPYIQPIFDDLDVEEDEILTKYIHYASGADESSVQIAIDSFVNEIKETTARDENFIIEQFGVFSKSSNGGLRFTPDWDAFNLSFSGLEILDLHPATQPTKTTPYIPPVTEPEAIPQPNPVEEMKEEIIQDVKQPQVPEIIHIAQRNQSEIDETTSRLWWMILGSALVLITVMCAYLAWDILSNRNKLNELVVMRPDTTVTNIPEKPVPLITDTPREESPIPEPDTEVAAPPVKEPVKPKPAEQIPSDDKICYVVVGAFKDEANVNKMTELVTSLGYEAEKITGGTLTRVAIRSSCDREILHQMLTDARAKINPEAWLY